jgi:hypothetical protein
MSDIKFSCPVCSQHIACDLQWGGQQIKCPSCQNDIAIPMPEVPPAAVASPAVQARVRVNVTHTAPPPAPAVAPVSPPPSQPQQHRPVLPGANAKSGGGARKVVPWAIAAVFVGGILYFALNWAGSAQRKFNASQERENAEEGGGQLGHIAELNSVLAATDPNNMPYTGYDPGPSRVRPIRVEETKLNPPEWTLETATAKIASGKVNGSISGAAFVADRAYLQKSPTGYILIVRQGQAIQADRELLIYLNLKSGEKLDGKSWTIARSETNGVPRVAKRWITGGRQNLKSYTGGYAMKIEFGQMAEEILPMRLFVALPDDEKSVISGAAEASLLLTGTQARPVRRTFDDGEF